MKSVLNPRALLWAVIISISGFSVYSQYLNQTNPTPKTYEPVCYESTGEDVIPEFRAASTTVRVNWITGTINYNGIGNAVGLSKYLYDEELNATICEVWIPMPKQVIGDADMDTIGHEFLHCIVGAFHQ